MTALQVGHTQGTSVGTNSIPQVHIAVEKRAPYILIQSGTCKIREVKLCVWGDPFSVVTSQKV